MRRWPSSTRAATIPAIPAALSTPMSASPAACGERCTTAAPYARMAVTCLAHLRVEHRIGQAAARKDDRRGAHRSEQAHVRELTLGDPVRAAGHDQEPADRRRVLHASHDLGEVRVGDVVDDDADDRHVALVQPAGQRVRDVVERPGRLQHPRARAVADGVRRGRDHPRDRGRGDPGQPGDVGDGCHVDRAQNGNVGGSSRTVTHCHSVNVVEVGLAAVAGAVARHAHAPERDRRLVVERAVVDVDHPGPASGPRARARATSELE